MDPRTLQQLKSLGYLGGSSTQATELTGQGTDPKDRLEVLRLLHLATHSGAAAPERISLLRQRDREGSGQSQPLQQSRKSVRRGGTPGRGDETV